MEQRAERLVRRARNGDTEAFTQLILRNEEMLSRVALSLLHNMEDAADAVQDAILAAWQALPSLREPRYFRTWLVRILIRCCSQVGASQGRHVHFQLEETLTAAVETPDWDEALDVQAALDTMKPEDKMLLKAPPIGKTGGGRMPCPPPLFTSSHYQVPGPAYSAVEFPFTISVISWITWSPPKARQSDTIWSKPLSISS